ncbi:hypothetical protein Scep_009803 [Stephania cephalantha]|uniref:F-box domain-containing protein n=1 Tax=Stephania cephalantha TaxID=152367 RepID=A0AAP0PDH2_9MAGN
MRRHHHHPTSATSAVDLDAAHHQLQRGKKRGNYSCGRCGQPKKGHICHVPPPTTAIPMTETFSSSIVTPAPVFATPSPSPRHPHSHLRRALSFEENTSAFQVSDAEEEKFPMEIESDWVEIGGLPMKCLWEVLRRLPPVTLLSAAKVCKGWRNCTRKLWRAAEELRLKVPARIQVGFIGSMLQKCSGLVRLSLTMESDLDATMLASIAFSCPNLEAMEVAFSDRAVNRITGDELGRFVAEKRSLSSLKIEGCSNLGCFNMCSSSLSTLWLSDLYSLSKTVFNCPNLKEISLDFSRSENDSTDLVTMVDGLGRSCPRLRKVHIASVHLSHAVVLALTAANLRGLRMLSLVLGSGITDASVAAIASIYPNLELLDLSGSCISDSGIGMICNEFPETLSRLLLALCPNITSSGIQFATAQLPLLELMDCGMSICDPSSENLSEESTLNNNGVRKLNFMQKTHNMPSSKLHLVYQKLIIKHARLKKLSLWGCSGLDALYLNCPELKDLNLTSCINLHPERLLIQCHGLENVHASGCQEVLINAINSQVCNNYSSIDDHFPTKRLADGSKRVHVPHISFPQSSGIEKGRKASRSLCTAIVA